MWDPGHNKSPRSPLSVSNIAHRVSVSKLDGYTKTAPDRRPNCSSSRSRQNTISKEYTYFWENISPLITSHVQLERYPDPYIRLHESMKYQRIVCVNRALLDVPLIEVPLSVPQSCAEPPPSRRPSPLSASREPWP